MTNQQSLFSLSSTSNLFDTYLVYGIIGLLLLIALVGLIILLATSCCCYCCWFHSSTPSCCYGCLHNRRHSSYQLRRQTPHRGDDSRTKIAFVRRHPSDIADFSQLYDSCPHLINSKAMTTSTSATNSNSNMETSCTTIDTLVCPISPCSSFRSFVQTSTLSKELPPVQNDLSKPEPQKTDANTEKNNLAHSSSVKGVCSRPFVYIKNTNDRAQILRRLTQHDCAVAPPVVPIAITRTLSSDSDNNHHSSNLTSTNIYETVTPTASVVTSSDTSTPIYESDWTHNLRKLMMARTPSTGDGVSVIELPSAPPPPDLLPSTKTASAQYFQQHRHPFDRFLAGRTNTSDSMRRTNMLRRIRDDSAFLY